MFIKGGVLLKSPRILIMRAKRSEVRPLNPLHRAAVPRWRYDGDCSLAIFSRCLQIVNLAILCSDFHRVLYEV